MPVIGAAVVSGGVILTSVRQISDMQSDVRQLTTAAENRERRLAAIETELQKTRERHADFCQQFAKVETQFGTVETVINELRVDDLRTRSIIWPKIHGQPYPTQFYEIKIPHDVMPC